MKEDLLIASIHKYCIANKRTLSVAESCTGGNLAARLTRKAGSSDYFLGSIVAYSNRVKRQVLKIEEELLEEYGAVSREVVEQMAKGVLSVTGSDYSLAVTGIAGPGGGTELKPVGTIWAAIACQTAEPVVWNFHLSGERQEIIDQAVEIILSRFCQWIQQFPIN